MVNIYIKPNIYDLSHDVGVLLLQHKDQQIRVIFDKDDYELINKYHWRISKKKNKLYVCTGQIKNGGKILYLANVVLNFTPNKSHEVDHVDGNSLNNQKKNLRIINRIDNIHNTKVRSDNRSTSIRGVSVDNRTGRYMVDFYYNKTRYYFKSFKTLNEAVYIRYLMEKKYLGEFRSVSNDERIFELIDELTATQKRELESYIARKINNKAKLY